MDDKDEVTQFFSTDPLGIEFQVKDTERELTTEELAKGSDTAIETKTMNSSLSILNEKNYRRVVRDIKRFVRKNNDLIICIDGDEGTGKSYFGMKLGKDLDDYFRLDKNVLFRPTEEEVRFYLFNNVNQYGCLMIDEAMDVFYKRRSATAENIRLNQLMAKVRKFNRIIILILPDFHDLDMFFRERRVRMRFSIIQRGLGFCSISQRIEGNRDPWFSDYNKGLMEKELGERKLSEFDVYEKLALYSKYRCFYSAFEWKVEDLSPQLWAEYEKMAKEANQRAEERIAREEQEKVQKSEKKYRLLFSLLGRHFMEKENITFKKFCKVLTDLAGGQPPLSEATLKKLVLDDNKNETDRKVDRLARIEIDKMMDEPEKEAEAKA